MHKKGIREVAHIAGVSISTVSRAFTRPELVSEKTRERVMEAASMLDFNISRSATALKSGQTFRVALLMNEEVTSWFNTQVFAGLNSVLHGAGYDISLFQHIDDAKNRESFFVNLPVLRNVDAVFVASFAIEPNEVEQLRRTHVPIIGINTPSSSAFDASISIDDEAGMFRAAPKAPSNRCHACLQPPRTRARIRARARRSTLRVTPRRRRMWRRSCCGPG